MEIKSFSEDIQGSIVDYTDSFAAPGLSSTAKKAVKGPLRVRPSNVEDAIQSLREVLQGKKVVDINRKKNLLTTWNRWIEKQFDKDLTAKTQKLYNAEKAYIQKILKTNFKLPPKAVITGKVAKAVEEEMMKVDKLASKSKKAENVLKAIAGESKTLNKAITKTAIKKLIPKIIPLLGAGLVVVELVQRIQDLVNKETVTEFSEQSGEYYHRDVGWY